VGCCRTSTVGSCFVSQQCYNLEKWQMKTVKNCSKRR
jgi:hypothetical protein